MRDTREKQCWDKVREAFDSKGTVLGSYWSRTLQNDPKKLALTLSKYKFAAKMSPKGGCVLELGCNEAIGLPILAEFSEKYTGVDLDNSAIKDARTSWPNTNSQFINQDFLGQRFGHFNSVVSMGVLEYIAPCQESLFFETVHANMTGDGTCIIGTRNVTNSKPDKNKHINLFSDVRLMHWVDKLFHNAFLFSMSDEIVHAGYQPAADFLIAVGCNKRKRILHG